MSSISKHEKVELGCVVSSEMTQQNEGREEIVSKVVRDHWHLLTEENLQRARDRRDIQMVNWWEKRCAEKDYAEGLCYHNIRKRIAKW